MKVSLKFLACLVIIFFILQSSLLAEYIFLKDGRILNGTITEETSSRITLKDKKGDKYNINRNTIMRILYTELYMGKVFVQKNDGQNVICYMVQEDRNTYIFRLDLYKPEEFTLRRDQVLFIARGNPSGLMLDSEPDYDQVKVKWFPPYNQVKEYNLYVKEKGKKEYVIQGKSRKAAGVIKDLKSNTKYYAMVKAVDMQEDESAPSNEIEFTTKNHAPLKIENIVFENIFRKEESVRYKLKWDKAVDTDGKIVYYKLYKIVEDKKTFVGNLKRTEYTFAENEIVEKVLISSVDDLGAESEQQTAYGPGLRKEFDIGFSAVTALGLGDFADLTPFGYGIELRGKFLNFYIKDLEAGFNIQFLNFFAEDKYNENNVKLNQLLFVPVTVYAGYLFSPYEKLRIVPLFHIGAALVYSDYDFYDNENPRGQAKNGVFTRPLFCFETDVRYNLDGKTYIDIKPGLTGIFENSNIFTYITLSFGGGYRF